eukprot:TRINITY_DN6560_c0_g2_i2.p1 TRINITY_DN6560_c0_g2~~TRINITY_DN6560_c0_g2_i2.p1  ORF type:complete len:253 (+),score=86.97 TRINITY_DN6560_c0_g2_i2:116-874(+)
MSSFAKAAKAQRKSHKERSQPLSRSKFGLLEKGKDWKLRRDDFKKKQRHIKSLANKARERNADEFYFGMISAKTTDGVQSLTTGELEHFTAEQLKVFKTQDHRYVQMKRTQEKNKIEKLQQNLHLMAATDQTPQNKHIIFTDSKRKAAKFDPAKHFDTVPELVNRPSNRLKRRQLEAESLVEPLTGKQAKKAAKQQEQMYEELNKRIQRERKIASVAETLELEKNLMGKGRRQKVSKRGEKPVYKWKKERKR